jgi:hypothetical protein
VISTPADLRLRRLKASGAQGMGLPGAA